MIITEKRADGTPGAFSGSVKLEKSSLSAEIVRQLEEKGTAIIPLPEELINESKLSPRFAVSMLCGLLRKM